MAVAVLSPSDLGTRFNALQHPSLTTFLMITRQIYIFHGQNRLQPYRERQKVE